MSVEPAVELCQLKGRKFRCLVFDAVGTLIYPLPAVSQVYFEAARRHGSRLTEAEVGARFKIAFRATERNDLETSTAGRAGLSTSEEREYERWREIVARVVDDIDSSEALFEELYAHFARPASWRCFDDVEAVLDQLAASGYRLVMASNFDQRLEAVCAGLPQLRTIERLVISSQLGARKPSRDFYEALFAITECAPGEVLMIGDDWENDILGATAAGASALLLNRRGYSEKPEICTLHELPDLLSDT